jgi:plastocyanin
MHIVARAAAALIFAAAAALLVHPGPALAAPTVHQVAIDAFEFHPPVVTVRQGDVVEWDNRDPVPHTATAKDAKLDSGDIAAGGKFRFTAKAKGRFAYICTLHPTMKGTLVVE